MGTIQFTDYDKITDTIMYLSQYITLNFCVNLTRKNKATKKVISFHSEYSYDSDYMNKKCYSIKRGFSAFFILNDSRDYNNSFIIRPQDIVLLQMVMQNNIIPWFIGPKRIFGLDSDNKIIIKGKYTPVDFPISDYKYLSFMPIVIEYEDNATKEGIRIIINDKFNYIDIDINKFMEFYYYICNTDIYCAATNLLNYVKIPPYGLNMIDMNSSNNYNNENNFDEWDNSNKKGKNTFFDNL